MKFKIQSWKVKDLINLYEGMKINLNPPYQRNEIWSSNAQKLLIDTIKRGFPLPTFFLHLKSPQKYDMVDGQQRSRAILGYYKGQFSDNEGNMYNSEFSYLNYEIPVVVIEGVDDIDLMREFYVRVNKTGLKLSRPELFKAQYFNTNFLRLVEELCETKEFKEIDIFRQISKKRMVDREFVEELIDQM